MNATCSLTSVLEDLRFRDSRGLIESCFVEHCNFGRYCRFGLGLALACVEKLLLLVVRCCFVSSSVDYDEGDDSDESDRQTGEREREREEIH